MKAFSILALLATASAFGQSGHGIEFLPKDIKPPVGAPTSDLELKKRQANEKFSGFAEEKAIPKRWDLESNSEYIAFGEFVTLLPKGAIIHVPEKHKANVVKEMKGALLLWPEFVARYPGLVSRMDVSLEEASGQKPIAAERLKAARNTGLIIVGVLNQNPITVSRDSIPPEEVPAR
ncbi:hypothetical protein OJ996_10185 [Luteolibacter sp. GHJ8]|uniref:Uncharacterized protein n=1 Tax=Luteolibacter rhizosphaerae TaxID=2989719 RepID=A0ABT3G283_9BACT|nr:hypothetical protein [Luteolibacter rhizosphaerae]MCW1913945.1 hypothetical protein [Luteolibacter rhizosphaerae]